MSIESGENKSFSRGYEKIKGAASAFNFDFRDKIVLDIGSSTGGFTQYALDKGARKVIAVEKGTRQMREPLRYDTRVELHEKEDIFKFKITNISQIEAENGEASGLPDVILADVSFLSLTKILKYAKMELSRIDTDYLVMLKPQFEARPWQLNKGVVKNEKMRREIIKQFEGWLKNNGFLVMKKRDNELTGRNGNQERFYWLRNEKTSSRSR